MAQPPADLPPAGAILTGPHWPDRVRVVRAEPRGSTRVLIEAVTLDRQSRLISRLLKRDDLARLRVETQLNRPTLTSDGASKTAPAGPQSDAVPKIAPARLQSGGVPQTAPAGPQSGDFRNASHQRLAQVCIVIDSSPDHVLDPYLAHLQASRQAETDIIRDYLRRSFDVLIARSQGKLMEYEQKARQGRDMSLSIQEERRHLDDLRRRQSSRLAENGRAAMLSLAAPRVLGVAAVVPAEKTTQLTRSSSQGDGLPMRCSDEVEAAAMARATAYEQARGWRVEDVSAEARGYDLLSRGPEGEVRYIEVKGRASVGAVELSANEWLKAEQSLPI